MNAQETLQNCKNDANSYDELNKAFGYSKPAFKDSCLDFLNEREACLISRLTQLIEARQQYLTGLLSEQRLTYVLSLFLDSARWDVECSIRYKKTLEAEAQSLGPKARP